MTTRPPTLSLLLLFSASCAGPDPGPAQAPVVNVPAEAAPPGSAAPAAPPAAPAPAGSGKLRTDSFGGDRWGFAEASSADGRLVVLRRFEGDEKPSFGHHGESSAATAVTVFDRSSGAERAIDEIIDVDPSRRWFLVLERGQPLLGDARSGAFAPLDKADTDRDHNACLAPRQATFSAAGKRVAWPTAAGLRVRDLGSGSEWLVKPKDRLWRGWPDDDGRGATLAEVPAGSTDWPAQNTSCACRWCGRFAMSYGFYGWRGPAFTLEHVAEDGSRKQADPPKGERKWHGKTESGCELAAKSEEHGLERGPWQWKCSGGRR
jgi:hypothetical protein